LVTFILVGASQGCEPPKPTAFAYHDPECWTSCGKKSGPCFRFCEKFVGKRGYCCRQGQEWKEGGCDGIVGGVNRHECSYVAAEFYTGPDCWTSCGKKSGPCNEFCGSGKYCCRKGLNEKGCDGMVGGRDRHECSSKPAKVCATLSNPRCSPDNDWAVIPGKTDCATLCKDESCEKRIWTITNGPIYSFPGYGIIPETIKVEDGCGLSAWKLDYEPTWGDTKDYFEGVNTGLNSKISKAECICQGW